MRIFEECAKCSLCSIFEVYDRVYLRIRKCQIRHRLYKLTFKIYDSVFLRVYLNILQ